MSRLIDLLKSTPVPRLGFHLSQGLMRLRRPVTLGVRAVVRDDRGRICLIRHTYRPGWHLPGGGVKRWETLEEACIRETREEAGVAITRLARLVGLYANFRPERSDHVALFEAADWHPVGPGALQPDSFEIAEVGFFDADALPADTGPATRRRLAELASGGSPAVHW